MKDKRDDIFREDTLSTSNEKTDIFSGETQEYKTKDFQEIKEDKVEIPEEELSRAKKHKKNKKPKKDKKEKSPEEIQAVQDFKKKRRRNRLIIVMTMLTLATLSGFTSFKLLNDKIGNTEANKELLYIKFKEAFTDDEYTEIANNVPKKTVDEINELYDKIPESTTKTQFGNWKSTLELQFNNQETAKDAISNLYEGSNDYIKESVTDTDLSEAEKALKQEFNHDYQNELLSEFEILKKQYSLLFESMKATEDISDTSKLSSLTQADFDNILSKINKNPNTQLKEKQKTTYNSSYEFWKEEKAQQAEEQARLDEEKRKQEEERLQQEIEQARKEAEYQAKIEAEREQARQEAYEKEQALLKQQEQERLEQERLEAERLEKERLEQERLEQEKAEQSQNNTTNSETKPSTQQEVSP